MKKLVTIFLFLNFITVASLFTVTAASFAHAEGSAITEKRFPFLEKNFFDGKKIPFDEFSVAETVKCSASLPWKLQGFGGQEVCGLEQDYCFQAISIKRIGKGKDAISFGCSINENEFAKYKKDFNKDKYSRSDFYKKKKIEEEALLGKQKSGYMMYLSSSVVNSKEVIFNTEYNIFSTPKDSNSCLISCTFAAPSGVNNWMPTSEIKKEITEFAKVLAESVTIKNVKKKKGKKK